MRLFIAEKPSLGKAIASGLGKGKPGDGCIVCGTDVVTWCFGHILEQAAPEEYDEKYKTWRMSDLPILPSVWKLNVTKSCAKQFSTIKKLVKEADEIVNGGDPDREGQLLVDEVLEYIGNKKPVKRILLNALDEKSVRDALADLRDNRDFIGLKNSALARSRADWSIGMNLTRAYTIRMRAAGYQGAASVGRVQTPTMALVVRREQQIKNFHSVTHYALQVDWKHERGVVPSVWQPRDDVQGMDDENRLLDQSVADALLRKLQSEAPATAKIVSLDQQEKQEQSRLPYSLSSLQIEAGRKHGLSPQEVLDTMQGLYEKKLTTYPRSDCDYLPENQLADVAVILGNLKGLSGEMETMVNGADPSLRSKAWNDKKISAHHAIIPTRVKADLDILSETEEKLYLMVATAYLAQFYPAHVYLSTKVDLEWNGEHFIAKGKTVKTMGWRSLYKTDVTMEEKGEDEEQQKSLPAMQKGDDVIFMEGNVAERETKPPSRFTPATLLAAMKNIHKHVKDKSLQAALQESQGIGTEATRAGIIETLQTRGFLIIEKKHLVPCEKAYQLCSVLPDEILYPDTTALWEQQLDEIKEGKLSVADFFSKQEETLRKLLRQAQEAKIAEAKDIVKCPNCGKPMTRRKGPNGIFWGCSGYPECKTTMEDNKGKPVARKRDAGHQARLKKLLMHGIELAKKQ